MFTFVIRRLLASVPTMFGVALIVFTLFNVVGGDPCYQMVGKNGRAQQIEECHQTYGFDQPKIVQFGNYLKQIVTFDFGTSYATKQPISDMIMRGVGPTLTLSIPAFIITTILSVLIALMVSYFRGKSLDRFVAEGCYTGMSIPILACILFGQSILAYRMGWFPISGFDPAIPDRFQYVALPIVIWIVVSLGFDVRFFRAAIIEETYQDYVRTARAKGLPEKRVFLKHVLKNSMIPIVTNTVIAIPQLILGSLLLENFFGIPGLGSMTVDAFNNSDVPMLRAMTTLESVLVIVGNLMTDVVYSWVDPRVKLK